MRRIGVLLNLAADDPQTRARLDVFLRVLRELGWEEGRNLRLDYRWGLGDVERHRANSMEIVALGPDVILAAGGLILGPLLRVTRTVPIVFVGVSDPVAAGFVESLARPGGNVTGFANFEYGMAGKWVDVLKQIAPSVRRVAVLRLPESIAGGGQTGALQAVAQVLGIELTIINVRDHDYLQRAVAEFARLPNSGMIVTTNTYFIMRRDLIVALAARHRLPTFYPSRSFTAAGGLVSYGPDPRDQYRLAAGYVDRILRGAKPAELPVQHPTKFELVVNLRTAKALGLHVSAALLERADEVIE